MFGIRHVQKSRNNPVKTLSRRWKPVLEKLEDRTVPATLVWQGDVDAFWNSGTVGVNTNWADQATSAQVKPQNGDSLLFPLIASNFTNSNDIAGLSLNTITFGGIAYNVGGNAITLSNLSDGSTAGVNSLNTPITVAGNLTVDVSVASTRVNLGGSISGAGGVIKNGLGTLRFNSGPGNSYTGTTSVNNGILELNVGAFDNAVPGNLVIGDTAGVAGSAVVRNIFTFEIANASNVTINSDGRLDGATDNIGALTVNAGGSVDMTLSVAGTASLLGTAGASLVVNSYAPFDGTLNGQTIRAITAGSMNFAGSGGSTTLFGTNANQTYNITGINAGNVAGTNFSFTGLENIKAGTGADNFAFAAGGSIAGEVDGGGGTDTLDYSALASATANLGLGTTGLTATLNGDTEVTPNTDPGTGTVTVSNYDIFTRKFDISITVSNMSPASVTGFHIHSAPFGVNGPIIIDLVPLGTLVPSGSGFTFNATGVSLPAAQEAAFLGGLTYVNIHTATFPGGAIRGQLFSNGNLNIVHGTGTGIGTVTNIENATGSSGNDSLVGSFAANVLLGNNGNDNIVGGPGADTMNGGANDDVLVWSNGDGTDVMDGTTGNDRVQVNGSLTAGDQFSVAAGGGGRVNFQRTSPGPFGLDIGTVETLSVLGINGDDVFTTTNLAGVTDLTALNLVGLDGNDTFNVAPSATVAYNIDGGPGTGGAGNNTVNFALTGITSPVYTPTGPTSGIASFGNALSDNVRNIQNITTAGGQFLVTINGTAGNDVITVFRNGANLTATISTNGGPATTIFSNLAPSAISTLVVNGLDGSDQLIVDHSTGIVNVPINYDGGPGSPDSLLVRGNFGGNFNQLIYIVTVPGAGSVNLDGNTINFSNLTPVTVTSLVGTTTINENSGAGHQLTLLDNPGAGLGSDVIFDGGLESLTFSNPTVALNVNAGDGNDTVTLFALDPAFAAPTININAGNDQDSVQILATKAGIVTNVDTAGGTPQDRTIVGNVFPFNNGAGSLANILGVVNVTDSGGIGQLFVDDSSNPAQTVGNMTGSTIIISGHTVNYTGNSMNDVEIALGLAPLGDTFLVNATSTVTTIFGNNGGEVIDIQGSGVVSTLTINGNNDNDSFNLLSPSPTGIININGGAPVFGDPTVPPGDKITVSFGGVSSTGLPDGTLIIPGSQNVNYTSIETLLLPDRFEFNNTIGTATFLGSPPFLTLDRINIHSVDNPATPANEADIDYFRYTAHDTGWLVVNAFFTDDPIAVGDNLILEVRDASDAVLASMNFNAVDGERMVIPVVGQRVYYIRVAGSNPILDANNYNLEIENFAAPVPSVVDLTSATDSGRSQTDNITNFSIPTFNIQADLSVVAAEFATTAAQSAQLAGRGLGILTPAQAQAGNVIGFAVQVFIDGVAAGFASVVPGTDNTMFTFTPTAPLADGIHQVTSAVRVFDVNTVPVQARSPLGSPVLIVTIDTVAPLAPTLNLNPPDDTGLANQPDTFRDNITSNQAANFTGNAAPDTWIQLTAFDRFNTPLPDFGTAYANAFGQYLIDPTLNLNDPFFFDQDGERLFAATATDLAGNQSELSNLTIFLDTRGPQVIGVLANGVDILAPKATPGVSITSIDIFFIDQPVRTDLFTYPAVNEILATTLGNYSLVGKKTGVHPIVSIDYVDASVSGDIGQTMVRLNFGAALPDDQYTLKVFDRVADVAFNKLDGDFFGALPSGDGVPGGNFVTGTGGNGSINLDNTPELGFYANGSVNLDINGDFIVNPSPVPGQDVIVPYGATGASVFTGQFSDVGAGAVSGFDRLGTYSLEGKKYYFRLDFNDDGDFSDPGEKIPNGLQINGLPIAGNWNFDKAGDEVGLFTGTIWYLDTDGDNRITNADAKLVGKMRGLPIAGDFDGDGLDDLATYQNGTYYFDFAINGLTGNADTSFKPRGFPGGPNGVASKLARPVAADFDRDGIDDVGLFLPNQTNLTKYQANWYFLVSNDAFGFNRVPGTAITLDHPFKLNQFPSGSLDFSATYGSSKGLPVVGNFDPPVRAASTYRAADVANIAHNLADMYFASSIDPFTGKPKTWR